MFDLVSDCCNQPFTFQEGLGLFGSINPVICSACGQRHLPLGSVKTSLFLPFPCIFCSQHSVKFLRYGRGPSALMCVTCASTWTLSGVSEYRSPIALYGEGFDYV